VSLAQIIYAAILLALWVAKADRHVMTWLTINLAAMLVAAGLMDIGLIEREAATVAMMTIDLATGVALAFGPGLSKIIAVGYAITIPLYSLELVFGVSISTTIAIVLFIAFAQLGVVCFDRFNGSGGGGRYHRGLDTHPHPLALSRGYSAVRATADPDVSQRLGD